MPVIPHSTLDTLSAAIKLTIKLIFLKSCQRAVSVLNAQQTQNNDVLTEFVFISAW